MTFSQAVKETFGENVSVGPDNNVVLVSQKDSDFDLLCSLAKKYLWKNNGTEQLSLES